MITKANNKILYVGDAEKVNVIIEELESHDWYSDTIY